MDALTLTGGVEISNETRRLASFLYLEIDVGDFPAVTPPECASHGVLDLPDRGADQHYIFLSNI